jgi:hypothetical protein
MGWVVNATLRPLYPQKIPGTHCVEDWVGPRAGLDGCGKSRPPSPPGIRFQDRSARCESLYRLSYSGPRYNIKRKKFYLFRTCYLKTLIQAHKENWRITGRFSAGALYQQQMELCGWNLGTIKQSDILSFIRKKWKEKYLYKVTQKKNGNFWNA